MINLQEFDFKEFKNCFKGYKILEEIEKFGLEYEFLDLLRAYFNYNNILDIMDVCDFLEYENDLILEDVFAKDFDKLQDCNNQKLQEYLQLYVNEFLCEQLGCYDTFREIEQCYNELVQFINSLDLTELYKFYNNKNLDIFENMQKIKGKDGKND